MTTQGFAHVYLETRNWGRSVAFWRSLGFEPEFETDHGSGALKPPAGGPYIFVAEQAPEDPLATALYLSVEQAGPLPDGVEVVVDWTATHWGTQVAVVRDPDGRELRLEAPATAGE